MDDFHPPDLLLEIQRWAASNAVGWVKDHIL